MAIYLILSLLLNVTLVENDYRLIFVPLVFKIRHR